MLCAISQNFANLPEMDKFPEIHKLPQANQEK
jgi:hypothetical protein